MYTASTSTSTLSLHDALPISVSDGDWGLVRRAHRAPLSDAASNAPTYGSVQPEPANFASRIRGDHRRWDRSEEHTSELQSLRHLVCRLLLEKKKIEKRTRETR